MVPHIKGGMQARIFENRILRRIFEPKRDENGGWRRVYNGELPYVVAYRSPN